MFKSGQNAAAIVESKGLSQVSDEAELGALVDKVIADNPGPVSDFLGGAERAFGFLMGRVMKASKGKANPNVAKDLLRKRLKEQA